MDVLTVAHSEDELLAAGSTVPRVVFDLDGTVYDTRDFERPALASVAQWLREKSGRPLEGMVEALWQRRESDRHRPGLFDELLIEYGLASSWGRECLQHFHSYSGIELQRAASLKPTLGRLRSNERRLALVTNGYEDVQRRKLKMLGLESMFDLCVFCDPRRPERLKPATWGWDELANWRAGLPTVYVGDDPVDEAFALAGGVGFIKFDFGSRVK